MKKELALKMKSFFTAPDWMLRKEVFIAILCIPPLFLFLTLLFTYKSINGVQKLRQEVIYLEKLIGYSGALKKEEKHPPDENFIKNHIETLNLLSSDKAHLAELFTLVDDIDLYSGVKDRLAFLESKENILTFKSSIEANNLVWDLNKPVEVSCLDLMELIALIEGMQLNPFLPNPCRPNMFISKLTYNRTNRSSEAYTVDIQIIQKR